MTAAGSDSASSQKELNTGLSGEQLNSVYCSDLLQDLSYGDPRRRISSNPGQTIDLRYVIVQTSNIISIYCLCEKGVTPRNCKQLLQTKGSLSSAIHSTEIVSNSSVLDSSICKIKAESFGHSLRKYVVRLRPDVRDHVIYANDNAYALDMQMRP